MPPGLEYSAPRHRTPPQYARCGISSRQCCHPRRSGRTRRSGDASGCQHAVDVIARWRPGCVMPAPSERLACMTGAEEPGDSRARRRAVARHPVGRPGRARTFSHTALLYRSGSEWLTHVAPFVADGLAVGEAVLVVASARKAKALRLRLGRHADRVAWADAAEWLGGTPTEAVALWHDFMSNELDESARGTRVVSEAFW